MQSVEEIERRISSARRSFDELRAEMARVIVGHESLIEQVFIALVCGGHCLLEGVPGLGKTLMVRSLGEVLSLSFSRIQFTPDLMPADITGTNMLTDDPSGRKVFEFQRGPVFAHIVLADEINRATPKTQSALLEAMEEKTVSVGKVTYKLDPPFFVLATQNPLEMEGTYPLPEAQLDRFFMKLKVDYPTLASLHTILNRTTRAQEPQVDRVLDGPQILEMRKTVKAVPIARPVQEYAIRIMMGTHPNTEFAHALTNKFVRHGASPRGSQAMIVGAKIRALLNNRVYVSTDDIRSCALGALRHRIILSFEGEAERVDPDTILKGILESIPEPS